MKHHLAVAATILGKVKLPKISNEVARLQEESMKTDPDVNVITDCINRNPRLFTKFLAIASFISKKEVTSARQAVDILGTKGIFTVFFSSAIEFSFQSDKESEAIINHASHIAAAMSELSSRIQEVKESDAYLYGLLYNIGYIVLNLYNPTASKSCYTTNLLTPSQSEAKELDLFDTTSNYIGVYVAKKWRVKNSVYCGILFQNKKIEKCPEGQHLAYELINLLNVARMVVAETENKLYVTEEIRNAALESMKRLNLTNQDYIRAQKKVQQLVKAMKAFPDNFMDEVAQA
ncbi:HDOD domain-containing protein [Thiomicrorhabdus sp. zzn3]|uniref:HDOD domain-containing protein n=1 Tax=Thiomicrorhabdus sp. zzn3 TaxID=3039775 RepID=UPI002436BF54|nr:HDOD domain-containing protein [Thiomicrorhabdus sp. zzn3]MDG6778191.1 HDOD domain-containing protein [Thiomicrorhabdus sp. zzn3]